MGIGISMGGLIISKFLQDLSRKTLLKESNIPFVIGATLLSPALSVDKLKAKPINKILLPISSLISRVFPNLHVGKVESGHPLYPEIIPRHHPLAIVGNIAARFGHESIKAIDDLQLNCIGTHDLNFRL